MSKKSKPLPPTDAEIIARHREQDARLRQSVVLYYAQTKNLVDRLYNAASAILTEISTGKHPLRRYLDPSKMNDLVRGLEEASGAMADLIPPAPGGEIVLYDPLDAVPTDDE